MEWDQHFFKNILDWYHRLGGPAEPPEVTNRRAHLKDEKMRLSILAKCLTGSPVEIYPGEQEGGLAGDIFFLPPTFSEGPTIEANRSFYFFRTAYMSVQRQLGHGWKANQNVQVDLSRKKSSDMSPLVLNKLFSELPGLEGVLQSIKQWMPEESPFLWGKWLPLEMKEGSKETESNKERKPVESEDDEHTEMEGPARELVEVVEVDQQAIEDYTLMHSFEKVETIEDFNGNWRTLDGSDDLLDHANAIEEADLRHTVRVDEPTHSTMRSEYLRDAYIPLSKEHTRPGHFLSYDEWDVKKQAYRPKYCKVYPSRHSDEDPIYAVEAMKKQAIVMRQLKKKVARFFNGWELVKHQISGSELDLDLVVDLIAEERAGKTPTEKIYLTKQRRKKDFSLLILMDLSLSTDSYVENRRVLDVEKQSVLAFCEVLDSYNCTFRIDGFSSQTRNNCDYLTVKDFKDPWNQAKSRIGGLKPGGYTRIGPALRHATHLLKKEHSRNRWILLLSDGKPNDFDRYEGRYGIEDVRQAIREASLAGVHAHALAIERDARFYLPRMFGHSAFQILNHPGQLVEALSEFFFKLYRS